MSLLDCAGTRRPVLKRRGAKRDDWRVYARRYGVGDCQVCGKAVACHKDGTAVLHNAYTEPRP